MGVNTPTIFFGSTGRYKLIKVGGYSKSLKKLGKI